jgi:hypothetical protein
MEEVEETTVRRLLLSSGGRLRVSVAIFCCSAICINMKVVGIVNNGTISAKEAILEVHGRLDA